MTLSPTAAGAGAGAWVGELRSEERGLYLIHLLLNCAHEVAAGALERASALLDHVSALAHPSGDPMQRLATSFADALARRALLRSFPGLLRSLSPSAPPPPASSSSSSSSWPSSTPALRHFFRLCPFLPLAAALSNHAVAAAMESERVVHVVDLRAPSDPAPAGDLLRLLASRPGGPPHLRLTAIHPDPDALALLASSLSKEAELLDVPFQFHPLLCPDLRRLDLESLKIKSGEALAVTSTLALHSLLSSSESLSSFLYSLQRLRPKVLVLAEQEADHNGPTLVARFVESLNFYAALFDCLESAAPRHSPERAAVERLLLGEEIRNIIVCDGPDRTERHEKFDRWARRLHAAGFSPLAPSFPARRLLHDFRCHGCKLRHDDACLFICWQDRPLFSVSAWTCRRLID